MVIVFEYMFISIEQHQAGLRLDKFLAQEVFFNEKISRGEIIRRIKSGEITVNQKIVKPSFNLKINDQLEIKTHKIHKLTANKNIKLDIVFENDDFLVLNKPADLTVHPVELKQHNTLVNGLLAYDSKIKDIHDQSFGSELRPGIVHRLDKDTSGLIIIARNLKTLKKFKSLFKKHQIKKVYQAITIGRVSPANGKINKPLAKSLNYKKQTIANSKTKKTTRPALTHYQTLKNWPDFTLLEVQPQTGRTHQIRIHLASCGFPIAGDRLYGKKLRGSFQPARQMLHAKSIEFDLNGKKYSFNTPLPEDFLDLVRSLDEKHKNR